MLELRKENKQLAVTLGYFVKKLAVLKKGEAIRTGDAVMREEASGFIDLSIPMFVVRNSHHFNYPHAAATKDQAADCAPSYRRPAETNKQTNKQTDFIRLQKLLLCALVIFNKRRPDEVASITIADYRMAQSQRDDRGDVINNLSLATYIQNKPC